MPTRRRPIAALAPLALAVPLALAAAGCHGPTVVSGPGHPDGPLKCTSVNSSDVVVSPPTVEVQDGTMSLSGTVHRVAGATGKLNGRVDIDLIGPDGLKLDKSLHAPLIPNNIPADPNVAARYSPTPFGYVPPAGSTLRARYVDRQEAIREGLEDGILDYNGNNGHTGEGVNRSQENGSHPGESGGGVGTGG